MGDLSLNDTRLIVDTCDQTGATLQQAAYVLATAFWETNRTMKPVEEAYWLSDDWRRTNLRYYPWHGRGYVQLTWERNYVFASEQLGLDLTSDPTIVMEPQVSADILVSGSLNGWFTGKKLRDYINNQRCDYEGARRVINGTDKARAIAALAREYEAALLADGYQGAAMPETNRPTLQFGDNGVAVAELQSDLAALGYFSGRTDGHFGPLTRAALLAFQADQDLTTDAVAGAMTWRALSEAEPRPPREVTQADIDAESGTAKDALMTARVGDLVGLGGIAGIATQATQAADAASGALGTLTQLVQSHWPALLLCGLCVLAWVALRALGHTTRKRRLRDAREHRSLAR